MVQGRGQGCRKTRIKVPSQMCNVPSMTYVEEGMIRHLLKSCP